MVPAESHLVDRIGWLRAALLDCKWRQAAARRREIARLSKRSIVDALTFLMAAIATATPMEFVLRTDG